MLFGVRHARLLIHRCVIDGDELTVRLATLMVVRREGSDALDWEVVAEATAEVATELGRNRLGLLVISGADEHGTVDLSEVCGDAVVVRFVDRSVVWRGDGPLEGFDDAWLT